MHNFNNVTQTQFFFGPNQENEVGRQIKYLGGSKVLLHYSKENILIVNLLDKVKRSLKTSGLDYVELGEVASNPRIETVFDGIKLCKNEHVDFILAIGAQAECASAKVIAAGAMFEDNFYDMFKPGCELDEVLPVAVISTTICGGSATSTSVAVSHKLDDGSLTFYECNSSLLSPKFIIYNPELCQYDNLNLEYSFIRILTLLFSIYFSVNKSTVLADRVIESTIKTVLLMYNKLKEKNNDLEYISNLMWASLSVHVSPMYNLSLDNCVNILTRAIVSAFDCTNEQASSLVIPAWFEFVLKKKTSRIAQLGSAVFNIPYNFSDVDSTAVQTVAKIKSLFENIGLPVKLGDLNGTGADIERILFKAGFPEKDSIGNNDKFSKTDCEVILSLTL